MSLPFIVIIFLFTLIVYKGVFFSFRPLVDEKAIDPVEEERKKLIADAMEELDEVDRLTGVLPPKTVIRHDSWGKPYDVVEEARRPIEEDKKEIKHERLEPDHHTVHSKEGRGEILERCTR